MRIRRIKGGVFWYWSIARHGACIAAFKLQAEMSSLATSSACVNIPTTEYLHNEISAFLDRIKARLKDGE